MVRLKQVCVFCGSNPGARPAYAQAAAALGLELVRRGIRLVYGGGRTGLMGVLADAVLTAGGEVTGLMPRALVAREVAHTGLTELRVVNSMHERKLGMAELAEAFIALPGGLGTLEEFCEVVTWTQLGIHRKPCALLNVEGFFDALLEYLDQAVREEFLRPAHRSVVLAHHEPAALLDALESVEIPELGRWIQLEQT
jgi:uncharacterized protein (TIGR00730 family)